MEHETFCLCLCLYWVKVFFLLSFFNSLQQKKKKKKNTRVAFIRFHFQRRERVFRLFFISFFSTFFLASLLVCELIEVECIMCVGWLGALRCFVGFMMQIVKADWDILFKQTPTRWLNRVKILEKSIVRSLNLVNNNDFTFHFFCAWKCLWSEFISIFKRIQTQFLCVHSTFLFYKYIYFVIIQETFAFSFSIFTISFFSFL